MNWNIRDIISTKTTFHQLGTQTTYNLANTGQRALFIKKKNQTINDKQNEIKKNNHLIKESGFELSHTERGWGWHVCVYPSLL